jgi:hypothetical protein
VATQIVADRVLIVNNCPMHFYDVSGLKHDRQKWYSYFDTVNSVIFVASLAAYDKNMIEETTVNQLVDSIVLFETVINNEILNQKNFLLLLNKKDFFSRKIKTIPINNFFPEYTGNPNNAHEAREFIKSKFIKQIRRGTNCNAHFTCCTDQVSMKNILVQIV